MGKGSKKKPPPEKPDWKKLEEIIAQVQKFLAPGAEVRHNHRVKGKSGRTRQLDVTLSQKIGNVPVFVVLECKKYKKAVGIEEVEKFAGMAKDVRASLGIMISSKGFDAGAKAVATQENILLKTYREADETDWKNYIGTDSWAMIIGNEYEIIDVSVVLPDKKRNDNIPYNMILFDENGEHYKETNSEPWTVVDLFLDGWDKAERPRPIGEVELTIGRAKKRPIFMKHHDELLHTDYFVIHGKMIPKKYPLNVQFVGGELLESTDTGKLEYIKASLLNFNVCDVMDNQEGVPFTKEEWEISEKARSLEFVVDRKANYIVHIEASLK